MMFFFVCTAMNSAAQGPRIELGDLQISGDRIPEITAADRIPVDTDDWPIVVYGGAATGAEVNAAIDALPPRTILELPDGEYVGHLEVRRSEVVVRGNCEDPGAVRWRNDGNPQNLLFSGPLCDGGSNHGGFCWNGDIDCPFGVCDTSVAGTLCTASWLQLCGADTDDHLTDLLSPPVVWNGPHARGSTTLLVEAPELFTPGDVVWLTSDVLPGPDEDVQTDDFNWMAEVTEVGVDSIVLGSSLPIDFDAATAHIRRFTKILRDAGVECLTLDHLHPEDPAGLYANLNLGIRYAWNSWLADVDLGDTFNNHARIERSARVVLLGNHFGEQHKSTRGDGQTCTGDVVDNPCWNKQAIVFDESHQNSFIDNILHASIGVEIAHSSSRNWIAYNYFPQPLLHPGGEPRRALFPHGNYGHSNVLEGNVFWGVGEMDVVWGSQGPRYVWFRNVALGPVARFSNEAWDGAPDPFRLSRDASYLLNYARVFGYEGGGQIDTRSDTMYLERNVYSVAVHTGNATANGTVVLDNLDAGLASPHDAWAGLAFPSTLNRSVADAPDFWCDHTTSRGGPACDFSIEGGIGAYWDDSCLLPARARDEGIDCSALFKDGFETGDTSAWSPGSSHGFGGLGGRSEARHPAGEP